MPCGVRIGKIHIGLQSVFDLRVAEEFVSVIDGEGAEQRLRIAGKACFHCGVQRGRLPVRHETGKQISRPSIDECGKAPLAACTAHRVAFPVAVVRTILGTDRAVVNGFVPVQPPAGFVCGRAVFSPFPPQAIIGNSGQISLVHGTVDRNERNHAFVLLIRKAPRDLFRRPVQQKFCFDPFRRCRIVQPSLSLATLATQTVFGLCRVRCVVFVRRRIAAKFA